MTIAEKMLRAKTDYDEVYKAGKQAEYDAFWDAFQENGNRSNWWAGFAYWNDTAFKPKYPLSGIEAHNYMFRGATVEEIPPLSFISSTTDLFQIFYGAQCKKATLNLTDKIKYFTDVFYGARYLADLTINGPIAGGGFDTHWSVDMTKASITGIVNALSATKTGLTVTLSLAAVKKAFETAEGANDGNTSTEWTTLAATKPNWTISLV